MSTPAWRAVVVLGFLAACPPLWAPAAGAEPSRTDALRIVKAESGLFGPPGTDASLFKPSQVLPLLDGQAFGWKMTLQSSKKKVLVREELTLPVEPRTWGDPEPELKRRTTPDGRTAVTEVWLEVKDGVIFHTWTITKGDPAGTWFIKVKVEDQPERSFRFEAR